MERTFEIRFTVDESLLGLPWWAYAATGVCLWYMAAVRLIRCRFTDGESIASLAREFGVDRTHIHAIARRKVWKCIT